MQPDSEATLVGLGVVLARLGHPDEGLARLREALRINPGNALTHDNVGVTLASQGKFQEAEAEFREALRVRPGFASAEAHLKAVLQRLAQPDAATSATKSR